MRRSAGGRTARGARTTEGEEGEAFEVDLSATRVEPTGDGLRLRGKVPGLKTGSALLEMADEAQGGGANFAVDVVDEKDGHLVVYRANGLTTLEEFHSYL